MVTSEHRTRFLLHALVGILTIFLSASAAWAQKGKGQGGGGATGDNGGGTIYFRFYDGPGAAWLFVMNDDGSGITPLPNAQLQAIHGRPSYHLHGGKRWFAWWDAFASDSGDVAPLLFPPDFELLQVPVWDDDDAMLTVIGRRWDLNSDSATFGKVVEGGIYAMGYAVDTAGNIVSSLQTPALIFASNLVEDTEGELRPDMDTHSVSQDGIQFVYSRYATRELEVGEFIFGSSRLLYADPDGLAVGNPKWSPQGDRIAFNVGSGRSRIMVINGDGTGAFTLAQGGFNWTPAAYEWSPTGSHIVYTHYHNLYRDTYMVRAKSDGSEATRITDREFGYGNFILANGWRADE